MSSTWRAPLAVTPDALERQLSFLTSCGWRGATFSEAVLAPPGAHTLAVTFDDGFSSVFELARPILAKLGLPGTVFLPTSSISNGGKLSWSGIDVWAGSPDEDELTPMSWQNAGVLAAEGWEIGSHTCTHPLLTTLDDEQLTRELRESREECERHLGVPCLTIAYPYGGVDERVAETANRVGYVAGAALSRRLLDLGPHRKPRMGIYHDDAWWRFRLKATAMTRRMRASRMWPESRLRY